MPVVVKRAVRSPTPRILAADAGPTAPPTFHFKIDGECQIDASTNLIDWWPVATVYNATNLTVISDTLSKRPALFFRVRPTI